MANSFGETLGIFLLIDRDVGMSEECGEVKEGHPPFFYWMRKELIDVFPFEKYKAINL